MSDLGQSTAPLGRGQGGDEKCPILDKRPPLLVEDMGVMRKVRSRTMDRPSW
jgi:hypothetical protein